MDLLILGSLLFLGGMFSISGLFDDGHDDNDDDTPPRADDAQYGTSGDDTLTDDAGYVAGWGGDDTITVTDDAEAWGNTGDDTIAAVDGASAHGGAGDDVIGSIGGGTAYGDDGDDLILGDADLYGGDGADLLVGPGGLFGGGGNDVLLAGGTEADTNAANDGMTSGSGFDLYLLSAGDGDSTHTIHDFDAGCDHLGFVVGADDAITADQLTVHSDTLNGFTDVTFTNDAGANTMHLEGVTRFNLHSLSFYDDQGREVPFADTAGNDTLSASSGEVHGRGGDDDIALTGDATGYGDAGNDSLTMGDTGDAYGGGGSDTLTAGSNSSGTAYGGGGDDHFLGDAAEFFGGMGNDQASSLGQGILHGDAGYDTLHGSFETYGASGDDQLSGHGLLDGGDGNDMLTLNAPGRAIGGTGDDTIWGDSADMADPDDGLTGGAGHDLFLTSFGSAPQTVHDFAAGTDRLGFVVKSTATIDPDDITILTDTLNGFTDITYATKDGPSTLHLDGVTDFDPADVHFYTDQGQEIPQGPTNAGDDTLSADHGPLSGGDGNDDLTLSGGGPVWGNAGNDIITLNNAFPDASRAYGGAGDDTLHPDGSDTAYGDNGNDSLSNGGSDTTYGGAGDDHVASGIAGAAYGGDGNDTITGNSNNYGDAGNDVMETMGRAYGGTGDDYIHSTGYRGEGTTAGSADGGAGNDTIIGDDAQYVSNDPDQYSGGSGDDLIATFSTQSVDAGAGNDTVIIERSGYNFSNLPVVSTITLGEGHDILALDPNAEADPYNLDGDSYPTVTVTDFDPAQDHLAIIAPEASLSNLDITITPDTAGGFTDVTLHTLNGDPAQTFRLTGVSNLDPADIQLYTDNAAVAAGTPWQTGVTA